MATESVARRTQFPSSALFAHDWTVSERPEELAAGLHTAASLLEMAYAGYCAMEDRSGPEVENTGRALIGDLVFVVGLAAHSLARHHGVLPSQQGGMA
jgi:hypothetical protein